METTDDKESAEKLISSLSRHWPAEYSMRESKSEESGNHSMSSRQNPPLTAGKMFDPIWCHYCNANKLDPKDKYYLPNGIEVCKECAAKHGSGTEKRKTAKRVK